MSPRVVFGGLALVLLAVNGLVASKEWLLQRGDVLLLPLEKRDPRSLMQGDYMTLNYALSRDALAAQPQPPRDGHLVVKVGEDRIATFARFHAGEPLQPGEHLLRYRRREEAGALRLGAESFFFQEGHAGLYSRARYGVLRVTASGDSVLEGLADEQRQSIGSTPR
ncbi:MAG TPA: GDYXXLXY domain-containing protein [Myxococcaceae bacterium]|nr:GDYXXLXY domain-containing protein [Myxococcaceae bacterium]